MARSRKRNAAAVSNSMAWMVTFSDLVTLLLTFFVLLLSMCILDRSIIIKAFHTVTIFEEEVGVLRHQSATKVESRYKIVREMITDPWEAVENRQRIKDMLFPEEILSPSISKSTLDRNLDILARTEGVAILLSEKLLFESGGYALKAEIAPILQEISGLLLVMNAPVNIAGYTDSVPGRSMDNLELSGRRALAVLEDLLGRGLDPTRFSASGYGPSFPLGDNSTEEGRAQNRRVEILIKTGPGSQSYL
jgi:chemotaxis protein MotB